jgi:hypothetical protein
VPDDLSDLGLPPGAVLSPQSLSHVECTCPDRETPALVSDAMVPEHLTGEGRICIDRVAHEAPRGVGVQAKHEDNEEVVRVPECFERLMTDILVGATPINRCPYK